MAQTVGALMQIAIGSLGYGGISRELKRTTQIARLICLLPGLFLLVDFIDFSQQIGVTSALRQGVTFPIILGLGCLLLIPGHKHNTVTKK
jgi:hypothetical protein